MRRTNLGVLLLVLTIGGMVFASPDSASAAVCDDYSNQKEAQEAADTIDADSDGVYCEANPCPCLKPGSGGGGGGRTSGRGGQGRKEQQPTKLRRSQPDATRAV